MSARIGDPSFGDWLVLKILENRRRLPWAPLAVAMLYYLGAEAAFAIGTLTQQFAPFWPPNVVLLCTLLVTPRRQWSWFILAVFPAHILAEHGAGIPWPSLLAAFATNVLVALLNAVALRRFLRGPTRLGSVPNLSRYLLFAVLLNPILVATVAGFQQSIGVGMADYWQFYWRWYLSNALGNLTLTPVFLAWLDCDFRPRASPLNRQRFIEALALTAAFVFTVWIAFGTPRTPLTENLVPAIFCLPIPVVLVTTVRFGTKGASGMVLLITIAVLFASMRTPTPFGYGVLSVQLFLAVVAVPVLILAALVEELQSANNRLTGALNERWRADQIAQSTRQLLQSSLDALASQIAILDHRGTILATNASWTRMADMLADMGEDYSVGSNFLENCDRARPHQQTIGAGLRRVIKGEIGEFRFEYQSDFVEGCWFQLRGTRFGASAEFRLVIANDDISEVKHSESALRRLTSRLMKLQDQERRRIARELHDSTAQNLLGAKLAIGQVLRDATRLKAAARTALDESCELIEQSQREIRTVAYLLHPPMLDEAGLPAALRWLGDGFNKRTEIQVAYDLAPDLERLPAEIEAALFRIAQEGLTNVHRHAESTTVRIGLRIDDSLPNARRIELAIEDNGKGFPKELMATQTGSRRVPSVSSPGVGLSGMRERLLQFGGNLEILPKQRGTLVRAVVPLPLSSNHATTAVARANRLNTGHSLGAAGRRTF